MTEEKYVEDEIDLRDYINVILKRKGVIFTVFFVAVITTTIVSFRMPKVYEITSTVQLGSVNGLLINKDETREIILNQNSLSVLIKDLNLNIDVEKFKKKINIGDISNTNLSKITIKHNDVDMALKINDTILAPLISQGQKIYQERISIANDRLKELDTEIKYAEEYIRRTQTLIFGLPASDKISQTESALKIILLQNTLPNYENNLTALRNQRNDLRILLATAKDFKVFASPIKPKYPIRPKKKQNVAISGIVSLIFGVFLAFLIEFWQRGKGGEAK